MLRGVEGGGFRGGGKAPVSLSSPSSRLPIVSQFLRCLPSSPGRERGEPWRGGAGQGEVPARACDDQAETRTR